MSLFPRGRIYWTYVWIDGVRHGKSTGTSNRRQAEMIDQQFKNELNLKRQGISQPKPEMTFGELAARFIAEELAKPYHLDRLKVLLPYWSDTPIGQITKAGARNYRKQRHAEKSVSDTTINRDLEAFRRILFWAVEEGFIASNPLSRVPMAQERRKPRLMVNLEEEQTLCEAPAPHLRPIIIIGLDTGMRRSELLSQRWEHVDLSRRILYVTRSKTLGGEGREIPLTWRVFDYLKANWQREGLILTFEGKPLRTIKTAWKTAIRRAGLRYFRLHDLRHSFNNRLIEAGVMQEVRKALMGHSSGEDINAVYTNIELPAKREAIRKLEVWIQEQLKSQQSRQGEKDHAGNDEAGVREAPDKRLPRTS